MLRVLKQDLMQCARYEDPHSPLDNRVILRMLIRPGGMCVALFRLSAWLYAIRLRPLAKLVHFVTLVALGAEIPPDTQIGPGFVIYHPIGIVVHRDAVIGRNVRIHTGTVLGVRSGHGRSGAPAIHDDSLIGAGAKILGSVTVGEGARVGANSVVTQDVPPSHVAVGVPATITPAKSPS
jgi:serine O-acetyltransferase